MSLMIQLGGNSLNNDYANSLVGMGYACGALRALVLMRYVSIKWVLVFFASALTMVDKLFWISGVGMWVVIRHGFTIGGGGGGGGGAWQHVFQVIRSHIIIIFFFLIFFIYVFILFPPFPSFA